MYEIYEHIKYIVKSKHYIMKDINKCNMHINCSIFYVKFLIKLLISHLILS